LTDFHDIRISHIWTSLLIRTLSFISYQSVITIWRPRKFGGCSDTSATCLKGQKWWSGTWNIRRVLL